MTEIEKRIQKKILERKYKKLMTSLSVDHKKVDKVYKKWILLVNSMEQYKNDNR